MPKQTGQKIKILYLLKFFFEETDEQHPVSAPALCDMLAGYGITAERKSVYSDIVLLQSFGYDINKTKAGWYLGSRRFQLPELKLLVDAVQSARFISRRKSDELIRKVEELAGHWQGDLLQKQVYVLERAKTDNETVYYNVDSLHTAIAEKRQVSYLYYKLMPDFSAKSRLRRDYRKNGQRYCVSPLALTWNDGCYYLVAYSHMQEDREPRIRNYRVDRMEDVQIEEEKIPVLPEISDFRPDTYAKHVFNMYGGQEKQVSIRFTNDLYASVLDRFGTDQIYMPDDRDHFILEAEIQVSPQFYSWIFGFGEQAEILSPSDVIAGFRDQMMAAAKHYFPEKKQ